MVSIIIEQCADNKPSDYDTTARPYCAWDCQKWATKGADKGVTVAQNCDGTFIKCSGSHGKDSGKKIKDTCKVSCNNCGKYPGYL